MQVDATKNLCYHCAEINDLKNNLINKVSNSDENGRKPCKKKAKKGKIVPMKRFFKLLPLLVCVFFLSIFGYYYQMQEKLIFRAVALDKDYQYSFKAPFEEVNLTMHNGDTVNAIHFFSKDPKGVIYYLHGQGENLSHWGVRAEEYVSYGYDVFVIDYRGFGKSTNNLTELNLMKDAIAGYKYLENRYNEQDIIVHGVSLGTAMASYIVTHHTPKMCILVSPYFNMIETAHYNKPILPRWVLKVILKYHLRTDEWIGNAKCPLYIFHGTDDRLIPYAQSEMIMAKLEGTEVDSTLFTLEGCGHNALHKNEVYINEVESLLR